MIANAKLKYVYVRRGRGFAARRSAAALYVYSISLCETYIAAPRYCCCAIRTDVHYGAVDYVYHACKSK